MKELALPWMALMSMMEMRLHVLRGGDVCLTYTNEPAPKERKQNQERAIAIFCCTKERENERQDDGVDETR